MRTVNKPVFLDLILTKEEITTNRYGEYNDEQVKLINLIDQFFKTRSWATNKSDELLYELIKPGVRLTEVADKSGYTYSTIKTLSCQLNARLKEEYFDGQMLSAICKNNDSEHLKKYISKFKWLLAKSSVNIISELRTEIYPMINRLDVAENATFTEQDVFNALAFLAMHSKGVIQYQLQALNPAALDHLITALSDTDNYHDEIMWYKNYVKQYRKAFNMQSETINKMKQV